VIFGCSLYYLLLVYNILYFFIKYFYLKNYQYNILYMKKRKKDEIDNERKI
jgi:hypothetical protein